MGPFDEDPAVNAVSGRTVLAIVERLGGLSSSGLEILARHGITEPKVSGWYRMGDWLEAFAEIAAAVGPRMLRQIGLGLPQCAPLPATISAAADALDALDGAFRMNHRGAPEGSYLFIRTGPNNGLMECRSPYPCALDSGLIAGALQRFAPPGSTTMVTHNPVRGCRSRGADCCALVLKW